MELDTKRTGRTSGLNESEPPSHAPLAQLHLSPDAVVLRERLANDFHVKYSQQDMGIPSKANHFLSVKYFYAADGVLEIEREEMGKPHQVLVYGRMDEDIVMSPALSAGKRQKTGAFKTPEPGRVAIQDDPILDKLVRSTLELVPEPERRVAGTFSVTLLRGGPIQAFQPAQLDVDYLIIYNVRNGGRLLPVQLSVDPEGLNVKSLCDLREGELLMIKGDALFHSFAPLNSEGTAVGWDSEIILMTVDRLRTATASLK